LPHRNQAPTQPPRDAVELAMDVLTDRWTFLILREAFFGVRRYGPTPIGTSIG
jgi:DNA-binding HxlR family transcriptional regulator